VHLLCAALHVQLRDAALCVSPPDACCYCCCCCCCCCCRSLLLQVETRACFEALDEVLSVPGITCAFLGETQLTMEEEWAGTACT
jgi:hypothetical protein